MRKPHRRIVHLSDGDRLVIHDDVAKNWITGDRIAVLMHGLCGSADSIYIRRTAIRLRQQGIRTFRVDMRGCGDSSLISTGHLHAGRSDDVVNIIAFIHGLSPLSKISLIGFSLGANILLKTLADWSDRHPQHVDSAIAVSPPLDLKLCAANLRKFGNRFYEYFFVSRLCRLLTYRRRNVLHLIDNSLNPLPGRLVHFDDQFTAPVNGFFGARDYYTRCSTIDRLDRICVPTILVAAQDDPVIPFEMFDSQCFSNQIEFVFTRHGGHLGFLGKTRRDPDPHWLDWRICQWLTGLETI